jgi:flavin-dependent dehydrogenase
LHSLDVLVVGAGPAGSIAALQLARAGVRVAIVDRATFPRHKLCGDTLNPGSLALLDRLGLADAVRARARRTSGMIVTGPAGAAVAADYPDGLYGLALTRHDMDALLVSAAVAAGADFQDATLARGAVVERGHVDGVELARGGRRETCRAGVVIAADGRGSRLGSAAGLSRYAASPRRWAYGAYYDGVAGLTSRGEMHIRDDGYVGIAPLNGGIANVCVVTTPRVLSASGPSGRRVPSSRPGGAGESGEHRRLSYATAVAAAIDADRGLRDRFAGARRVSDVSVLGPLATIATGAGVPGLLLAGDAAGFIDPMTGDGLRFALRGGELAAAAALRELDTGVPAHPWLARQRAEEFGPKWRINRLLRALVGSPRALDAAALVARRWPAPVEYLIGVAGDVSVARERGVSPTTVR